MNIAKHFVIGVSALLLAGTPSLADSISDVEGARANERSGRYLSDEDIDKLNRYGGNDDRPSYYGDTPDDERPAGNVYDPGVYIDSEKD